MAAAMSSVSNDKPASADKLSHNIVVDICTTTDESSSETNLQDGLGHPKPGSSACKRQRGLPRSEDVPSPFLSARVEAYGMNPVQPLQPEVQSHVTQPLLDPPAQTPIHHSAQYPDQFYFPPQPQTQHFPPLPPQNQPQDTFRAQNRTARKRKLGDKENMVAGRAYDPSSPQLVSERQNCRSLLQKFSQKSLFATDAEKRALAREFLGKVDQNVQIEAPFYCEYGYNIQIGKNTCIGPGCTILDPAVVWIGSNCYIGPRVTIYCKRISKIQNDHTGTRRIAYGQGVWIEDKVCIEGDVVVYSGVRIGTGSTITPGSVVTTTIPSYSYAGGNPARPLEYT